MAKLAKELDQEVAWWRQLTFAESTKACYKTHRKKYLAFCKDLGLCPAPASTSTICRYVAYLGRSYAFTTIQQYINIIRIIHLDLGLDNPLHNNWILHSLLKGLKRGKGAEQSAKLPINPEDLKRIHGALNLTVAEDCVFWAAILTCFFGLLRVSNVSSCKGPSLRDISVTGKGIIMTIRKSKTIQFKERTHIIPLPYIANHPLCPTSAILAMLGKVGHTSSTSDVPLFQYYTAKGLQTLSADSIRRRLHRLLVQLGYPASSYGTHSLRRGGATWLLLAGVPLPLIKLLGDWKSDCVTKYLKPSVSSQFDMLQTAIVSHI